MTIYRINQRIIFNDEDGSLRHTDDEDPAHMLAVPATRLLAYLIMYNRVNLSREDILRDVWEKNGLVPSNNNLNHYISQLRRLLSLMGERELIKTLPKIGFSLLAEISIENGIDAVYPVNEDAIYPTPLTSPQHISTGADKYSKKRIVILVIITLFFFSILATFILIISGNKKTPPKYPISFMGQYHQCQIYKMGVSINPEPKELLSMSEKYRSKYSLDCEKPSDFYISSDIVKFESGGIQTDVIYFCPKGAHIDSCFNMIIKSEF